MDNDQRQSWWPDENSASNQPDRSVKEQHPSEHDSPDHEPVLSQENSGEPSPEQNQESNQQNTQNWQQEQQNTPYWQQSQQDSQNCYQNQQNSQNWYQNQKPPSNRMPAGNSMVTASIIMGIISVLLICCGISYFFGALGIIFALLSRKDGPMESQAKVGLGLSIAGAVGGIVLLAGTIISNFSTYQELYRELEKYYQEDDGYNDYEDFFDNYDKYLEEFNPNDSIHSDSVNANIWLNL